MSIRRAYQTNSPTVAEQPESAQPRRPRTLWRSSAFHPSRTPAARTTARTPRVPTLSLPCSRYRRSVPVTANSAGCARVIGLGTVHARDKPRANGALISLALHCMAACRPNARVSRVLDAKVLTVLPPLAITLPRLRARWWRRLGHPRYRKRYRDLNVWLPWRGLSIDCRREGAHHQKCQACNAELHVSSLLISTP